MQSHLVHVNGWSVPMELKTDDTILRQLCIMVQKFRESPHTELEVRLGHSAGGRFQVGVPYDYSMALYAAMTNDESLANWDEQPVKRNFKYVYYENGIRATHCADSARAESHRVERVGSPIDVYCPTRSHTLRFSIKTEEPVTDFDPGAQTKLVRIQTRLSILDAPWRYDFSRVGTGKSTEDACQGYTIQVELELMRDEEYLSHNDNRTVAITMMGRARDLLGRFSESSEEEKLVLKLLG